MFFFPFNSFGNIENIENVLSEVSKIKNSIFLIFSYNTDKKSDVERKKYYNNCQYDDLRMIKEMNGTRFTAKSGLNSIAYNPKYLLDVFKNNNIKYGVILFADIGIAYGLNTYEKDDYRFDLQLDFS